MPADKEEFEALPQRPPKAKRQRSGAVPVVAEASEPAQRSALAGPGLEAAAEPPLAAAADAAAAAAGASPGTEDAAPASPRDGYPGGGPLHATLDLQEYRSAAEEGQKFEYLDHTADVQLHAWGETLREAFENVGLCMFNYMTPLSGIRTAEGDAGARRYAAEGHDLPSLLYHWLDEMLFSFSTDFFVPRSIEITRFDLEECRIEAVGRGEQFDRQRHASGTEIKAITYSAMQINQGEGDAEVFVIVDI